MEVIRLKHYSQQAKQRLKNEYNVEFGQEFGVAEPLDQEAKEAFLTAKEGGMITRRLVELGEKMLVTDSKDK